MLIGRRRECTAVDDLLATVRAGSSQTLVVRGEEGIGKTALLDYARDSSTAMRIAAVAGAEAERALPLAAADRLLMSLDGPAAGTPRPEEETSALAAGLSLLAALSTAASEQPLLCTVDDVQWLDAQSAESLAAAARRLTHERIALLLAVRDPAESRHELDEFPDLRLSGLSDLDAAELLIRAVPGPLNAQARNRIVSVTGGNPQGLLEVASALSPRELAGASLLPDPLPLAGQLAKGLLRRVRSLPEETQLLVLLLAAEPSGDVDLLWRAAAELGIPAEAIEAAESAGIVEIGPPATFTHALTRSAVYSAAPAPRRRLVHRALADAIDADLDPGRRSWHRASASAGPDEDVASELERTAAEAARRGSAGAAMLLRRSAQFSPDRDERMRRTLAAVQAELAAGDAKGASALLTEAEPELANELHRAQAKRLSGTLSLALGESGHTSQVLLDAAQTLEQLDIRMARDTYLEALEAALFSGPLDAGGGAVEAARAARAAPPVPDSDTTPSDLLLDGWSAVLTGERETGTRRLREAIAAFRLAGEPRWMGLASLSALELLDDQALRALATRRVQLARDTGALTQLPSALAQLGAYEVLVGRLTAAEALFEEARVASDAIDNPGILGRTDSGDLIVAAWRGNESRARAYAETCIRDATARGVGTFVSWTHYSIAILELGHSRYEAALIAAQQASTDPLVATRTLPELVEAAVRSGEREVAISAVGALADRALPSGTNWALGMLARSRALVAEGNAARKLYEDAIEHLKRCQVSPQLARARLLYGEWLRRERRRRHARKELRLAYELFTSMGLDAFADRTATELVAVGERVRRQTVGSRERLTPHEHRIAALVREGATNAEIATQLSISPRTVEYHLHKVFRKLGVSSRTQLVRALPDYDEDEGRP